MKNTRVVDGEALETGNGNIFPDLGLPNPEKRLLKAQLMLAIRNEIECRKLTQVQASELQGLAQHDLSRIATGRGNVFSAKRLMEALCRLGSDIEIVISNTASGSVGKLHFRERRGLRSCAATCVRKRRIWSYQTND